MKTATSRSISIRTPEQPEQSGDTLAEFIVSEIRDTFDSNATRCAQLEEARRVLMNAVDDLEAVIERLQ
jgi:hypothetical protein